MRAGQQPECVCVGADCYVPHVRVEILGVVMWTSFIKHQNCSVDGGNSRGAAQ